MYARTEGSQIARHSVISATRLFRTDRPAPSRRRSTAIRTSPEAPEHTTDVAELACVVLCERGLSEATVDWYRRIFNGLAASQPDFAKLSPSDVRKRLECSTSRRAQYQLLSQFQRFFRICRREGWWIGRDPTARIDVTKLKLANRRTRLSVPKDSAA